jgi:hypothetical protein
MDDKQLFPGFLSKLIFNSFNPINPINPLLSTPYSLLSKNPCGNEKKYSDY